MIARLAALCCALLLSACTSVGVEHYRDQQPRLVLDQYLNGTVEAWGMVQDRQGTVNKRFHVVIDARWNGNQGVLDERFRWADGSQSQRIWRLVKHADGHITGTADDVIGEARGEVAGNAFRWRYVLAVPVDGKVWHVDVDDWMYLVDDKVMLNRSTLRKWGIDVGEVTLAFIKR